VLRVANNKPLPADLVAQIVDKTDGVPLFLEELTKAVLESSMVRELADRYEYSGKLEKLAIPSTLRDSLMARLDRLLPVKEIAQIGAVLGREFSYELVHALSPMSEVQLNEALDKLVGSELVFRRGTPPNATYIFKHALVQDAAYESLLKGKRQALHAQIAQVIEQRLPSKALNEPELIAHHYSEAGMAGAAVPLWSQAGERALSRVALAEAVSHFAMALEVVGRLPSSPERDARELDIRMRLGVAHQFKGGWAAPEVIEALDPARVLAARLGRHLDLVPILYHTWLQHVCRCELPAALKSIDGVHEVAVETGHWIPALVEPWLKSMTYCYTGEFVQARRAMDELLSVYDFDKHSALTPIYNHEPKCGTLLFAGYYLWALGYPDRAKAAALEQADVARKVNHAFNRCWCLLGGNAPLVLRGDCDLAVQWADEAYAVATEQGMTYVAELVVPWWRGNALIDAGRYEEGYAQVTLGSDSWQAAGGVLHMPLSHLMRGKALMHLGRLDEAAAQLDLANQITERTGHRMYAAEIARLRAVLMQRLGHADAREIEAALLQAIDIARSQSAKGYELRTAMDLARLWRTLDRRREAIDLLSPIYDWFTEGHDTRDLREAEALLAELR
jgi:predicted ATPase